MSHEDLRRLLTHRDTLALVSESQDGEVVGFLVYSIHTHLYEIERLAVAKKYRRNGVGTALLNRLKDKASRMVDCESQTLRWRLATWLTEKQVTAQIFLKANGFRCTYQTHSVDGDSEERFVWSIQASS
jgi:GNAT superfamily N-acetyltransferase